MDEVTQVESQASDSRLSRIVKKSQCPICGTRIHSESFCCPKCRNYFCFHCRARMSSSDIAMQCRNRECDHYGKLVCDDCDPAHDQRETPSTYKEPIDGYWPLWLMLALTASILVGIYTTVTAGVLSFLGLYLGLGYIFQSAGFNIFGRERLVELQRVSKVHTCISCEQPTKTVSLHDR
jgi:hypothetical protein